MVAAASVVVAATVGALVNLLTGDAHSWLLFTLAASAVGFLAAIEWWRNVSPGETLRSRLRSVPTLRDAVPRSDETQRVIRQLLAKGGGSVGITTALSGAGGFGKTTLARMVATDPAVRRRFPNQVEIVLGKDVLGANLAGKINDLIHLIAGETTSFTDPQVAGQRLGQLLDTGPGTLLLVDDVWSSAQVRPFVAGGARCARLFTTRIPSILPVGTPTVTVDQMSPAECVALLTGSVPGLSRDHATGLSEATGRWPLLLSLTNGALRAAVEAGEEANASAAGILRRLAEIGPEALDVSVGGSRELAAKATIEIGTDLLGDGGAERLEELGIFPEDTEVPLSVIARLWARTGRLDANASRELCRRMAALSLVLLRDHQQSLSLHDVIRGFLRYTLGTARLASVNADLVAVAASTLPPDFEGSDRPWWRMPADETYFWTNLPAHLADAGATDTGRPLAVDLRWVTRKLELLGPSAVVADLAATQHAAAMSLLEVFGRSGHLLRETDPRHAVAHILLSRLHDLDMWRDSVVRIHEVTTEPFLRPRWALPDSTDTALTRVMTGHDGPVRAMTRLPDGRSLVTVGDDATVRYWDPKDGAAVEVRYTDSRMTAVVTDTEGQWVATVGNTGVLRFWTEHSRRFRRRVAPANNATIAVAPNGDWIATAVPGGYDVSVYRIPNGRPLADLHIIPTVSIGGLMAPDSAHVTVVDNGHLITFDLHGGYTWLPYSAGNHTGPSTAAPVDDDLIAIGCHDGTVLVVDRGDGTCLVRIDAHFGQVTALVAPPDGTWIASAGTDKTIRIWDTGDGRPRASFLGHTGTVHTMAVAPDGTWLASAGEDSDVRLWDVESGRLPAEGSLAARSVAVAVDGSVVVTAGHDDALVRTWQTTTGSLAETQSVPQRLVRDKDLEPYQQILAVEMARGRDADALGDAAKRMVAHAKWNSLSRLAVASGADILAAVDRDGLVMVVEGARPPTMPPGPPEDGVDHLALSADGTILVTVARSSHGRGARVKAWNSGTLLGIGGTYLHGGSGVTAIGFDSDGRRVLLGLDDGTIAEWHFTSGVATHSGHEAAVRGIAYDDRGHRWATVGEDGAVRIWTTDLRECLAMIRTDGPLADCAWLIDDDTVVAVGARGIYGFDLLTDSGHTGSRSRPQ